MKYGIEINVNGKWAPIYPPDGPPPYSFESKAEAETLARVLYPSTWNNPELCRIKEAS